VLHKHTLLNHGSRYIYIQPCSLNKAMSCALGKVGKPRTALKDEHLMAIQHTCSGKDMFVRLQTDVASPLLHTYEFLPFVFASRIHFGKAELTHILLTIYLCYYLRVQLTYLDELRTWRM